MSLKYIKVYTDTLTQYLLHSLCNSNVKANEIDSIKTKLQERTSSSIVSYLQLALIKMKKTSVNVSNFSKILFRNGELNISLAGQWLPATGGDGVWAVRTGSGSMRMCGDIFAAARLWRGRLLTTGHLSSRHPVVGLFVNVHRKL